MYIFFLEKLGNITKEAYIISGTHSDHDILVLKLVFTNVPTSGRGFWKIPTNLLQDNCYVDCVKKLIEEYIKNEDQNINALTSLETVKVEIRNYTIPYCFNKSKLNKELGNKLNKELTELEEILIQF